MANEVKCEKCGGLGIVGVEGKELVVRCPDCDPDGYAEDWEDFGL